VQSTNRPTGTGTQNNNMIYPSIHFMTLTGTLKLRDMKQRERNQRHKNVGAETARNGNNGTMLWKMRVMDTRERRWLL